VIIQHSNEWLPRLYQEETFISFHVVRMELSLYHFPNDMFRVSGFLVQDTGVIKLDIVTEISHQ
jgi:hypothetical protein